MLSFKKLTWRNWDPVTRCITQQRRLNNRLCQSLTMTELEQGFSQLPVPHREPGSHNSQKKFTFVVIWNYAHLHFSGRTGPHEKQRCHQAGHEEMRRIFEMEPWSTSMGWAVWWSPLQGFKECVIQEKEKLLQMASRVLPSSTAALTVVRSETIT